MAVNLCATGFGVTHNQHKRNAAAILEWIVAFVFTFYVLSFVIDLLPAVRTRHHTSKTTEMQVEQNDAASEGQLNNYYGNGTTNSTTNGIGTSNGYATTDGVAGPGHGPGRTVNGVFYPNTAVTPKPNLANNY